MSTDNEGVIELKDGQYLMNDIAFQKLMAGFRCGEKTENALKLMYVDRNRDRQDVIRKTGVKEGTLSKAIVRFDNWIEQYQANNGVKRKDYLVPRALELLFDAAERDFLTGQSTLEDLLEEFIKAKK